MRLAFLFLIAFSSGNASRILFLFPTPSKSHLIVVKGLSTTLAERGHDVTVVSPYPLDKPMKNYRDINVKITDDYKALAESIVAKSNDGVFTKFPRLIKNLMEMGNGMLSSPEFKKVMEEEKFDLVIIGMFFNNYLLGVGDHFKCPTMMLSVSATATFLNTLVGNPMGVSSVRHQFYGSELVTFKDRVLNFLIHGGDFAMIWYLNRVQKENYDLNFPSDRYRSFDESQKNLSMILLNSHFSQGAIRPYVPAMVEVGGLQVKPVPDKLPEKFQTWLDGAGDKGVVFFSLGSNAKTTFLPREKIDILLKVFSKLKQRVIMKWESDELDGKPDNVLISKWVPQDDILAHPNLKVFISHCGLGSVAEAKYHGVPIVAMPLGIDQITNADSIVAEGWAEKVEFFTLTEEDLLKTTRKVLENPKYLAKAKTNSQLYKDRPTNARETAVFWVEYVIRYHGAPHLRYPAADLNFWQDNSVDVVLFLLVLIYIIFKVTMKILKFLLTFCFGGANKSFKHKKN